MLGDELVERPDAEHHRHAAIEAITETHPAGAGAVFADRQRADVAELALVEIARGGVMHAVRLLPVREREQREQPETRAHPAVGARAGEERAVAAVVLQDEQAHVQRRRGQRQQQRPQVTPPATQRPGHACPESQEGQQRVGELPESARQWRLLRNARATRVARGEYQRSWPILRPSEPEVQQVSECVMCGCALSCDPDMPRNELDATELSASADWIA